MMTDKDLLKALDDLKYRLNYLHNRNLELENENKYLREAYENRVNEYLKLKDKVGGIDE